MKEESRNGESFVPYSGVKATLVNLAAHQQRLQLGVGVLGGHV